MEFSITTAIFALANFLLLLVLLRLFLYKPIRKMMDERQQIISESLAEAEKTKQQAATAGDEIRAQLEQARETAEGIISTARAAGDELKKQLLAEARVEATAMAESARAALKQEREEAIAALRAEAASLAVATAGRILAEEMSADQQQSLLHKYIAEVGRLQ